MPSKPRPAPTQPNKKEPKNFATSPGKRGTGYGYADVAFSKIKYESDPYDSLKKQAAKEREADKKLKVSQKQFVPTTAGKSCFSPFIRLPASNAKPEKEKKEGKQLLPFKPCYSFGNPINHYPFYEPPKKPEPEAVKKAPSYIFKPSGVNGTYPTRSIIDSNVPLAPPIKLREAFRQAQSVLH